MPSTLGEHDIKQSMIQFVDSNGKVRGCGILVDGQHVATCAHVIAMVVHGVKADQLEEPRDTIHLFFPYADSIQRAPSFTKKISAHVIVWKPATETPPPDLLEDIAMLRLDEPAPAGAVPNGFLLNSDWAGRAYMAHGFPESNPKGDWADGTFKGEVVSGWVQMLSADGTDLQVDKGFSGAGVWDDDQKGFAGILVANKKRGADMKPVSYMIPTALLKRAWCNLPIIDLPKTQSPYPSTEQRLAFHRRALRQRARQHDWWDRAIPLQVCGKRQENINARDELWEWVNSDCQHCLILGNPGAGKTGLMWWMASRLAELENSVILFVSAAMLRSFVGNSFSDFLKCGEPPIEIPFEKRDITEKQCYLLLDGLDELVGVEAGGDKIASDLLTKAFALVPTSCRVITTCRTPAFVHFEKTIVGMLPDRLTRRDSHDRYEAAISRALGFSQTPSVLTVQPVSTTDAQQFLSRSDLPKHLVRKATTSAAIVPFLSSPFCVRLLELALPFLGKTGSLSLSDLYRTYVFAALARERATLTQLDLDEIVSELQSAAINRRAQMSQRSEQIARSAGIVSWANGRYQFAHYSLWEYFFGSALFGQLREYDSNLLSRLDLVNGYNINRMLVPMVVQHLSKDSPYSGAELRAVPAAEYQDFCRKTGWRLTSGYGIHPSVSRAADGTASATFPIDARIAQSIHNDMRHGNSIASAMSWYDAAVFAMHASARLPTSEQLLDIRIDGNYFIWGIDWHNEEIGHVCALDTDAGIIVGINPDVRLPTTALAVFV